MSSESEAWYFGRWPQNVRLCACVHACVLAGGRPCVYVCVCATIAMSSGKVATARASRPPRRASGGRLLPKTVAGPSV